MQAFADLNRLADAAEQQLAPLFAKVDANCRLQTQKVLAAFAANRVSDAHFAGTTGYGYDDLGREVTERVAAQIFGGEAALFRHSFASGTHALTVMLMGVLRPGMRMVCVTGTPYDTLHTLLGIGQKGRGQGNFLDYQIQYDQLELLADGSVDINAAAREAKTADAIYIQRSRGYAQRPTVCVNQLEAVVQAVKAANPHCLVLVDNCYCEFIEEKTPLEVGADLMAGSLIKNPGGGMARCGGYIIGRKELVELCAYRLTAPGVGGEVGCTLGETRELLKGLLFAPSVTASALKTAMFAAALFQAMGFEASPKWDEPRGDIIQMLYLKTPRRLVAFCKGVQAASPVDAFATPEPAPMPGYDCPVVMAAGAFTQGSSIELSADAPLRAPYTVYLQGGLTYDLGYLGILSAAKACLALPKEDATC